MAADRTDLEHCVEIRVENVGCCAHSSSFFRLQNVSSICSEAQPVKSPKASQDRGPRYK